MKKALLSLALTVLTVSAFAQAKSDDFKSWEIGVNVGTQAYVGEHCRVAEQFMLKDWLTVPAVNLDITKWATPTVGFSINANWAPYKGAYDLSETEATFRKAGDPVYDGNLYLAKGSYAQANVAADINVTNLFGGYNPDRLFNLVALVGGGVIAPTSKVEKSIVSPEFLAGLKAQFNLTEQLKFNVNAIGALIHDKFNGCGNTKAKEDFPVDGTFGITVGITYSL